MDMNDIEAVKTFADKNNLELYFKIHPKTDENKIKVLSKNLRIEENRLLLNRTPVVENILVLEPKIIFGGPQINFWIKKLIFGVQKSIFGFQKLFFWVQK